MADTKQQVLKMIEILPDEITIDDIMAELYFKMQVDAGLQELDDGKGLPHEEAKKIYKSYRIKSDCIEVVTICHGAKMLDDIL